MRITIRLDDDLLAETKALATQTDRTLTAVIEDALRQMLAQQQALAEREPVRLNTVSGMGLLPSVDLNNSAVLLDIMESDDDAF